MFRPTTALIPDVLAERRAFFFIPTSASGCSISSPLPTSDIYGEKKEAYNPIVLPTMCYVLCTRAWISRQCVRDAWYFQTAAGTTRTLALLSPCSDGLRRQDSTCAQSNMHSDVESPGGSPWGEERSVTPAGCCGWVVA